MKAIILAAGYATRLRPLTDVDREAAPADRRPTDARLGLRQGRRGRPTRSTSSRTRGSRRRSSSGRAAATSVTVHDDGTSSNEDRLGAIGDIAFVLERDRHRRRPARDRRRQPLRLRAAEHGRVLGDEAARRERRRRLRLSATSSSRRTTASWRWTRTTGSSGSRRSRRSRRSTLAATAAYLYHRAHVPLVRRYLAEGNPPDQPGRLIAWLYPREPVYGYRVRRASGTTSGAPSSCSKRTTAGGNASACRSGTSTRRSARRRAAVPAARTCGGAATSWRGRTTHRPHQLSKGWSGSF